MKKGDKLFVRFDYKAGEKEVGKKDPLVQMNFYKYKLYEWDIAIVSKMF